MPLSDFPRLPLAHLPTPLEPLPRLSAELGGPRLYVKRDDCTGLAFGGNKTRKLEFLMAAAQRDGADTVITAGGLQSNHVRQTAAAAARLGFACELVLSRNVEWSDAAYGESGNLQLDRLLDARLHLHPGGTDRAAEMDHLAERLRAEGRHPYIIPIGGSNATGSLGYAAAALELVAQCEELDLRLGALVHACSSGGTFAGLEAGLAKLDHPARLLAVDVNADPAAMQEDYLPLVRETAALLGLETIRPDGSCELVNGHAGEGYGLPTAAMKEAVQMVARLEGLLLDPVYSGKAMAGLIAMVRAGRFGKDDSVVFLHSGGTPALFAYPSVFASS